MKKEIFGGPRRTDAKATCAGRAGKRRTDPISTRRFFAKRSAEGSDGAKKKDREIDVGRLVSRDPQGRPNLERRVRPPRSVCPQHVGESAIFQRFKIAPLFPRAPLRCGACQLFRFCLGMGWRRRAEGCLPDLMRTLKAVCKARRPGQW